MICGGTMFGNCATGKPRSETMPPSTVTIAITIATMGRRMKKAAISVARPRARGSVGHEWFGAHFGPGRQRSGVDDHAIAGVEAVLHDPPCADPLTERDGFDLNRVVGRHNPHLRLSLEVGDRPLRDQLDVFGDPSVGADATVLAGPKLVVHVGERRADSNRARLLIDLTVGRQER